MRKNFICMILVFVFILLLSNNIVISFAHSAILNVEYDECVPDPYVSESHDGDSYDEKWYEFKYYNSVEHFPHNPNGVTNINYYVSTSSLENSNITWTSLIGDTEGTRVKNTLKQSLEKWNNIYFYSTDTDGYIEKRKLINIQEVSNAADSNVILYPKEDSRNMYAYMNFDTSSKIVIEDPNGIHYHYTKARIFFNLAYFNILNESLKNIVLKRTGAHEMGHVLGLEDIDEIEESLSDTYHHEEILMGYGKTLHRQTDITYKDLVGVAITRGYHTDRDHKWLYDSESSSSDKKKLICSICNAVKYVPNLLSYSYYIYKVCSNNHNLSSGNMFAVASYNNYDYFKCKYCRYVAPFNQKVLQNYIKQGYSNKQKHKVINQVSGLSYTFLENHLFTFYRYFDNIRHRKSCRYCGEIKSQQHSVTLEDATDGDNKATCLGCDTLLDLNFDIAEVIESTEQVTLNGSFILPNGIVVLAPEDIDAFEYGTLIFYNINELPVID